MGKLGILPLANRLGEPLLSAPAASAFCRALHSSLWACLFPSICPLACRSRPAV